MKDRDPMEDREFSPIEGSIREKMISWVIILIAFITVWYMIDIALLTFIIAFIFYHLTDAVQKRLKKVVPVKIPDGLILSVLYVIFIFLLVIISYEFMPKIVSQIVDVGNALINFDIGSLREIMDERFYAAVEELDFGTYLVEAGRILTQVITRVSIFGLSLFISLILSYFLILEKKKIRRFAERMAESRISFIYSYLMSFGKSFVVTFGKVMRVQVTISAINSSISMIMLLVLGFPQVLGLGIMIFFLGLIPVAGVVISLFPLSVIAFNIGGISKVIAVLIMILAIHGIEAYMLNPKLMSDKTDLPICFVFIILLVAEHYMGVWGLLIGVPIFLFLMSVLEVDCTGLGRKKKRSVSIFKRKNS